MAIQKLTATDFIALSATSLVLDVRSPGEYKHAHMPGAYNLPLFSDEERKVVGTSYKQQNRKIAIKTGLDYFGVKMKKMVEEVEGLFNQINARKEIKKDNTVLVHCWRGGMRSAGVAWLLDLYGFKVYSLTGGYKAYRAWAREQFTNTVNLTILGGYTGSAKTVILNELSTSGYPVIDLEALACHKGSAFGAFGEKPQPSQEMFENLLAEDINILLQKNTGPVFLEDESQRIGTLMIPEPFWQQMRQSPVLFLDIPFEDRLDYLTLGYGKFEKELLINAIIRIQKKLGGLETKTAINYLLENNHKECFRILLHYYDKYYTKSLNTRQNLSHLLTKIICENGDPKTNIQNLINEKTTVH